MQYIVLIKLILFFKLLKIRNKQNKKLSCNRKNLSAKQQLTM